ncbi:hypothetical protein ACIHEJ_20095 [Streptomyces sp. NPDC052301]|uniref:hypothetical protein n=1 Tax=Streptomyces sp. NPDC052301 TaxID=3365687 RepID=UPI0037CDFAAD
MVERVARVAAAVLIAFGGIATVLTITTSGSASERAAGTSRTRTVAAGAGDVTWGG